MAKYVNPRWVNGSSPDINATNLNAISDNLELTHAFGVCGTAAATAAKAVTIDYSGTLALFAGLAVQVKFSNANTAASPTLNVNGTGAKPIYAEGARAGSGAWYGGQTLWLVYDGTNWNIAGPSMATIENLKSSVSSGKSLIAAAVTDMGVQTAATDPFETMAGNIRQIQTGGTTETCTVTVTVSGTPNTVDVLSISYIDMSATNPIHSGVDMIVKGQYERQQVTVTVPKYSDFQILATASTAGAGIGVVPTYEIQCLDKGQLLYRTAGARDLNLRLFACGVTSGGTLGIAVY